MKGLAPIVCAGLVSQFSPHCVLAEKMPIEEVVVVGSKIERPIWRVAGKVDVLDRDALDRQQLEDFAAISRYVPALEADFSSSRFGSTGLSIRGIGGNRVAFELDGVPLPQQMDIGSFADNGRLAFDPAIIKRTEILRGPASVLYGSDAIAGVVVLTTVDGRDLVEGDRAYYTAVNSGYYSASNSHALGTTLAWAGVNDSLLVSYNRRNGHEYDNRAQSTDSDRINYGQHQFLAKWTHDFQNASVLRTRVDYYDREADSDLRAQLGFERFASTKRLQGEDSQQRLRISSEYSLQGLPWLDDLRLSAYWQTNRTEQLTDQYRDSRGIPVFLERDFFYRERDYGGELRLSHEFSTGPSNHIVVAGIEWDRQVIRQLRDAAQTSLVDGTTTNVVLGEVFPLRDMPRSTTDKLGLYLQDEVIFGDFSLIPALRWDHFRLDAGTDEVFSDSTRLTDLSGNDLTFRLGATWRVHDAASLYFHYAEGFRAPPAEDINLFLDIALFNFRAIPNPDLKPERSSNIEGGLRLKWQSGSAYAGAYQSRYDNFIESRALVGVDVSTGGLLFQSRNLEEATIYGVEAEFDQSLAFLHDGLSAVHLQTGFHWAHGNNDITGQPLNTVSPLKINTHLRWSPQQLPVSAELRLTHYGRQSRVDFGDGEFFVPGSATVADLLLEWRQSRHLQVFIGVYNIGNNRYWRYNDVRRLDVDDPVIDTRSQPGTNLTLTVHGKF